MKKILLLSFVFLFASLNLNAQFVDPPDGIVTHIINGAYVVDGIYYTTIQQAVTAAGTTGIVDIPSNYTGTDTYTNPNNITIFDYRAGNPSYLDGSITVPSDPTLSYQLTTKHYVDGSIASITGAKGSPGGYAQLDSNGYVLASEIPSMAITNTFVVTSTTQMIALAASVGDVAIVNTGNTATNASYILQSLPATTLANWILITTPDTGVITVNGLMGNVTLGFPNISGTLGCAQLPALTGDITSVGCVTTAGGNVALLNGANTFTSAQNITLAGTASAVGLNLFQSGLVNGGSLSIDFGVNTGNFNGAYLSFNYAGTASTSNVIGLGLDGANPFVVYGTSAVSWNSGAQIASSSNVCQTNGTNCPAGLIGSNYAQLAATTNTFTGNMAVNGGITVGTTGEWQTTSNVTVVGSDPGIVWQDTESTPEKWILVEGIAAVNNGILGFYNQNNGVTPLMMFPTTGDVVVGYNTGAPTDNNTTFTSYARLNNSAADFIGSNAGYVNIGMNNTSNGIGVALFQIGTTTPISTWPDGSAVLEAGTTGGAGADLVLDAYGSASGIIFQANRVNTGIISASAFNTYVPISAPYILATGATNPPASDTVQGAYIAWNYDIPGQGSTNFVNLYGGGVGGFTWQNGSNTSALTQLMTLSQNGALSVETTVAATSFYATASGGDAIISLSNVVGGRDWTWDSIGTGSGVGPAGSLCAYNATAGSAAMCISAANATSLASSLQWAGGVAIPSSSSVALLSSAAFTNFSTAHFTNSSGIQTTEGFVCGGTFGAGATCGTTISLNYAEPDTNYIPVCSMVSPAVTGEFITAANPYSTSLISISIYFTNANTGTGTSEISCIVTHS
jgi:hypothetical protein